MLIAGQQVFLRLPHETRSRILHPARVADAARDVLTVQFEEPEIAVEPGAELVLYLERDRDFLQVAARVHAALVDAAEDEADAAAASVALELLGAPRSAESRSCFRVSTVLADIVATLGAEHGCPLQDVSATGFAVVARTAFAAGNTVDVTLEFDENEYMGAACVQSVRALEDGRYRYGLHCLADRNVSTLERGLAHISSAVQRRQLRRLQGTG